jgi:hypothetical protein
MFDDAEMVRHAGERRGGVLTLGWSVTRRGGGGGSPALRKKGWPGRRGR